MPVFMSAEDLERRTDEQLLELWKRMTDLFTAAKGKKEDRIPEQELKFKKAEHSVAGILALSKETERRGLEMIETKFGRIILQPKKQIA